MTSPPAGVWTPRGDDRRRTRCRGRRPRSPCSVSGLEHLEGPERGEGDEVTTSSTSGRPIRELLADRLLHARRAHAWQGTTLVVAEADEAWDERSWTRSTRSSRRSGALDEPSAEKVVVRGGRVGDERARPRRRARRGGRPLRLRRRRADRRSSRRGPGRRARRRPHHAGRTLHVRRPGRHRGARRAVRGRRQAAQRPRRQGASPAIVVEGATSGRHRERALRLDPRWVGRRGRPGRRAGRSAGGTRTPTTSASWRSPRASGSELVPYI